MSEDRGGKSGKKGWSSVRWGSRRVSEKGLEGEMSKRRGGNRQGGVVHKTGKCEHA
jgi:hypothetical protein